MTVKELLDKAAECVTCGKVHTYRQEGRYGTWAGRDGHPYRTRLFEMTGNAGPGTLAALRELAGLR